MLCAALACHVGWTVWDAVETGSVTGRYGPIPQARRPATYLITIVLTTLAAVLWSAFALILGVVAARWPQDGPR